MAEWKLLGEVPDSDDDDAFDNQSHNSATTALGEITTTNSHDIWEFTNSPEATHNLRHVPTASISLNSSPLSSAQSVDGLPELDAMFLDGNDMGGTQESLNGGPNSGNSSGLYVELANRVPTSFKDIPADGTPSQRVVLPSQDLGLLENTHDLQREAVRLERSLRPRKPIQEHPYLLENAQYSSLIRQHGMRPVQMAMARTKSTREENIQDGEFQDESQENTLPEMNNSSQLPNGNDLDESGDLGIFNFPSSSPPKTSPWISHGRSSNHGSSQGDTDNTSVPDQDLPALHEMLSKTPRRISHSKRPNITSGSSARKRRRHDVVDSDPVDAENNGKTAHEHSSHGLGAGPLPPIPRLQLNTRPLTDVLPPQTVLTLDNSSPSESEGIEDKELREQLGGLSDEPTNERLDYKRRIRGVLPASWLRLDQKSSREKAQKHLRGRQRNHTAEKEARRGLARTRTISNAAVSRSSTLFFDASEDDETAAQPATTDGTFRSQSRIVLIPDETPAWANDDLSDEGSIIEHDTIDSMFTGSKQRHASSYADRHQKAGKVSKKCATSKHKQQKITASLKTAIAAPNGRPRLRLPHKHNSARSVLKERSASRSPPKSLSVLDVIEAGAPQFLRVAARTARTRVDQGRSSPSKKILRLASRLDHVDAAVSLARWKSGFIPQRQEVSDARKERRRQASRRPFAERTVNPSAAAHDKHKPTNAATKKSRKFVKQTGSGGSAHYLPSGNLPNIPTTVNVTSIENKDGVPSSLELMQYARPSESTPADSLRPSRPAILEVEELANLSPLIFHRRKRFLDRIYRSRDQDSPADQSTIRSEGSIDILLTVNHTEESAAGLQSNELLKRRDRLKKPRKPVRVDVDAPQFRHAADPLPASYTVDIEPERAHMANAETKLTGLGPYGTQYTTHFEIFPLGPGVYFHQSTLLGSGIIEDCQKRTTRQILLSSRPRVSFQFGTYSCRWGDWNARTSSELGIMLDLVAEELEKQEELTIQREATVLEAAKFISTYARAALNFSDEAAIGIFVTRVLEVVGSFHTRLSSLVAIRPLSNRCSQTATRVYDNLLVLVFVTLMVCTEVDDLMKQKHEVEDLMRNLAAASISNLLLIGVDRVQASYTQLRETTTREGGLREDQPCIHSWALLMLILEAGRIPRGSFWDVLKQTIAANDQVSATKIQTHEQIWEIMFTMLPLSEFNSTGILIPGRRYETNCDGWSIVQQLLRQVFAIYRENTQQASSFNNYCRALIGRCHYLVQQWGWRRSGSIVGTIFDFFGSQNLEHLRNEEANASPRFLDHLAEEPSLAVEQEDQCFHVFLKLLALSIHKLRAAGAVNDIRNLVARTIPNHNRQHLKEQTVYERDLAALRNHHDLLATLYWAAPPELRPSPALMERLVAPETSHKEASLINIQCWNKLSRFIVATGEASREFKPFHQWRNSFFQKMVQQFDSAAADIQQQLLTLPMEVRHTVTEETISSMISMNKAAVVDVLQASIAASLDVMKHATDLEAATFCLNTLQLQHVYKQFGIYPPELNWDTLRDAICTLDVFLGYIAEFKEKEESQQNESQILNSAQADDAILLLEHEVSTLYFSMVRCILSNSAANPSLAVSDDSAGTEKIVAVAVRLAAIFINGGLTKLHDLFKRGRYGLFDGPIHKLKIDQRQYLVLVVAALLRAGIYDFADVEFTLCELWLLALVRPKRYLKYESQLADILRQRGEYFVPPSDTGLTNHESNDTLFEFAISTMRSSIRDAGPNLKRILVAEHSKALKLVMEQMKEDLKATSSQPATHVPYVAFARRIISLIRTHGSEICTLDSFYYQISKDYSPPVDDPQLQIAAMKSYGLRLREGDTKVIQQVFFFLFNNFKIALVSDNLSEEKQMLQKGMRQDRGVTQFILGKMLPAIIEATASKTIAYPLLDLYVWAAASRLKKSTTTYTWTDADILGVRAILQAILNGVEGWIAERALLTAETLHTLRTFFAGFNLLWPSIYQYSLNQDEFSRPWNDILKLIETISRHASTSKTILSYEGHRNSQMRLNEVFAAVSVKTTSNRSIVDKDINGFADNIKQDVDRNWVEPGAIPCRNLIIHGAEATGKSSVSANLFDCLCETNQDQSDAQALLSHARVDAAQCITVRHLYERIVSAVASALQVHDLAPKRCETMAQLAVALGEMLDGRSRDNPRWRFALVLDSIDRQRDAPATLLPALARLSEMIPSLTCVWIVTSLPAGFLRSSGSANLHFPAYTKQEYVRILALSPPAPIKGTTQQETSDLWARFCAAVHDSLIRAASRTLPSFKDCCHALWPRFTSPIVAQTHTPKEFSKLLVAARVHFQDESLLNRSIVAVRPGDTTDAAALGKTTGSVLAKAAKPASNVAELTSLLPTIARLLLLTAYLASHNPSKHDLTLFSTFHHGRKRRRGGSTTSRGGAGRSKHRKIARKLLGSHAFVLERMMAIFEAARAEWIDDGRFLGAAGVDGDVGMALATLVSLRLLVRVGAGDMVDRSGKWRINVSWEAVRGIGRSIGVEVEEWLIE
ncbi:hypothetical protein V2A60_009039 [Cordyceps javanica]